MTAHLPDDVRALLAQPNPAVITAVREDGQPVSVATWYLLDGDRVLVNMDASRKRIDYLKADPRVSLTALAKDDWYTHVSLQGRVTEWADDVDLRDIDRLAQHYGMDSYGIRDRPRVSAWIEIDRWHGWGQAARS